MSVYRDSRSPYFWFDFQVRGHRFFGSTKATTRREAEAVERTEREKAKQTVAQSQAARSSLRLDDVAGRYWHEVGQHTTGAADTHRVLGYLIKHFGKDKLLTDITGDDVAWRRGNRNSKGEVLSPFTVNATTATLKKLFTRAKAWGVRFEREPQWKRFWLNSHRSVSANLSGMKPNGWKLLPVRTTGRSLHSPDRQGSGSQSACCNGRKLIGTPARSESKARATSGSPFQSRRRFWEILWPLRGHHPDHVFTFVARRTDRGSEISGQRYPLTVHNVNFEWAKVRRKSKVTGFRFHDFRHNLATKVLRETGNLKLVQQLLNHSNIATTVRYAHVLDTEVAAALERVTKSRKKSRTNLREIG